MDDIELKLILEALLMSSEKPLSHEQLVSVFDDWQKPDRKQLEKVLDLLAQDYQNSAIELKRLASGYCFQTRAKYGNWVSRLQAERPARYSRALLETLAIIAYRQPVTRADIEEIRGVTVSSTILKTLMEREWVKIAGHRDVPGKPAVYVTTRDFLDYFNLASIDQLPLLMPIAEEPSVPNNQPVEECIE
ncbi:SMC-Scp complex subunit ScpB [Legionella dresdenensis]|uniref:SMC-Scp complex subunit ScpB n=1 Tax=Legionella dresdenensis TaxID=450200 RepID=A0ABV8CBK0_9GAMM